MKLSLPVIVLVFTLLAAGSPVGLSGQVPRDALSLRWTVGPERVRIGDGNDPEELFQDIVGIVLTRDGSLVIGDMGSDEIRFFDAMTGRHIRTVGGSGQGPGEINRIWDLLGTRDELIAVDASGLASRFDLDGAYVGQVPRARPATFGRLNRAGFFDDGTELASLSESNSDVPPGRTTVWMGVFRVIDGEPRSIMRYRRSVATRRGSERPGYLAFGPLTALVPLGDRFCLGFPVTYLVECFTQAGDPLHEIVREGWQSREVTREDRDAHHAYEDLVNTRDSEQRKRRRRENTQFAEELPSFDFFVAGPASELWVGPLEWPLDAPVRHPTPRGETVWSVYDRDGALLSDIVLPPGFLLTAAGEDYVAGLSRDDFDVQSVVVYELNRSR